MRRSLASLVALVAGVVAASPAAASPLGTLEDPHELPENPFAIAGSTVGAPSSVERYDCAPTLEQSGGERVYLLEVPLDGKLTAWVEGDGGGVDIDVHIVVDPQLSGGTLSGCVGRGDVIAEADVPAGPVWVVVDSYQGAAQEGPYVLRTTFIGDDWTESEPFEGVVWRAKRYESYAGGRQVVHQLLVDLDNPFVTVEARQSSGCQTIGQMARELAAVAAINGGYFTTGCAPVSLLKHAGTLLGTNAVERSAFGLNALGEPLIDRVAVGADWPAAVEAHGGGPRLVVDGVALTSNDDYAEEGITAAGFIGPNPRTFAGIHQDGRIALVGVDGRRPSAAGMSLPALATWSVALELTDAVNLDGGGSTTVYVEDATPNGVVNYPSDGGTTESPLHTGSRGVSGGLFVFSQPKNYAPVFRSDPPLETEVGASYLYEADAYDKNPHDVVTFAIGAGPPGLLVDAATGRVTWSVPGDAPAAAQVVLVASDGELETEQAFTLAVDGGTESGPSAVGAGGAGAGGAVVGAGGASTATGSSAEPAAGGCACRVGGTGDSRWAWALLAVALAASRRRSRGAKGEVRGRA